MAQWKPSAWLTRHRSKLENKKKKLKKKFARKWKNFKLRKIIIIVNIFSLRYIDDGEGEENKNEKLICVDFLINFVPLKRRKEKSFIFRRFLCLISKAIFIIFFIVFVLPLFLQF